MRVSVFLGLLLALVPLVPAGFAQEPGAREEQGPVAQVQPSIDPFRRGAPLNVEPPAAPMVRVQDTDIRRQRGWPEQPPTIPHRIDGYQLDKNSNRCMVCHSRSNAERFQAPMVSVTHFMDRNGQMLAQLSARRYFCDSCHVVQSDARPPVENEFVDVDTLLRRDYGSR